MSVPNSESLLKEILKNENVKKYKYLITKSFFFENIMSFLQPRKGAQSDPREAQGPSPVFSQSNTESEQCFFRFQERKKNVLNIFAALRAAFFQ